MRLAQTQLVPTQLGPIRPGADSKSILLFIHIEKVLNRRKRNPSHETIVIATEIRQFCTSLWYPQLNTANNPYLGAYTRGLVDTLDIAVM